MRAEYIKKLTDMMEYDAMLICPSEELLFFTGFSPMMCERFQGLFVKKDGSIFYLCNALYGGEIMAEVNGECPVYTWHDNEGMGKVYSILKDNGLWNCTIGVNSSAQAFNVLDIAENCNIKFVNGKPMLEEVRIRKTHEELENMRKAAKVADNVYDVVCGFIRPGITEGDIRDLMVNEMVKQGGGGSGMFCIVASGPNSGFPHYSSYDRVIEEGDCIVLDWGCAVNEMMSDMSRTVFVGSITDEQRRIYDIVDRSQLVGETTAKEGVNIPEIDIAARNVLAEYGYAETLVNRVGHGIGYSVHEGPYINQINHRPLEKGMCFSVEPGVYLAGRFGMRIENIVCIDENGETEILNKADRSLRVLDWWKK